MEPALSIKKIDLRKSHPTLYRSLMVLGFMGIALAFNFWFSHPTFNPYGIHKDIIGCIFFVIESSLIVFLTVFHNLRMVRIILAISVSWMFFWGLSNTQQVFAHKASFQLPILFVALSILKSLLLIESPVNPMTEKR